MKKFLKFSWPFITMLLVIGLYTVLGNSLFTELLRTLVDGVVCFAVFVGIAKLYDYTVFMGKKSS